MAGSLSNKLPWELANPKWAASLNPVLANVLLNGRLITNIVMTANVEQPINHGLQQLPQGWIVVDNVENAQIWRSQPFSTTVLVLESNANTTISIWVF